MEEKGLQLPGYEIGSVLYRSGVRVVLSCPSAWKMTLWSRLRWRPLDAEYPDRQQVAVIRREGTIAQRLSEVEGVRKVYAVLPHGSGNLALVC